MSTITRHAWVGVLGLVLANACSASSPPPPQPAPAPAPAPVPSAPPPAVAPAPAQPSASVAPAASAPAPTVDRCALSEPRVVVPNQALIRGFDVGHDGRLYWAQYEPMSRETRVLSLDTADREAKPQPIASAKMVGGPGDLVSLREGFWIEVDDDSRGVCGGRLMWLARDATRAVPVSNPACVFGPKRGAEGAEAIWGTSPTFSHAMQLFVAKGAPPQGVASVPRKVDGAFDVVAVASDGVYVALEHGEVIRRRPDGKEERVARPTYVMPPIQSRAVAVHGDHVFLGSGKDSRSMELFRVPRAGGEKVSLGTFEQQIPTARLHATDSGVVLHLHGNKGVDRLLLIDPSGACPNVELPLPDAQRRVLVHQDVAYVLQRQGIVATSFAARRK